MFNVAIEGPLSALVSALVPLSNSVFRELMVKWLQDLCCDTHMAGQPQIASFT